MAELGQQTVEFSTLVSRAAEESFISLKELVEKSKSSDMSDSEKKINLLKFIVKTQQRLQQARAPIYDVPSAIEVLLTGSYERLPKCIEDVGMQSSLNEIQQKPALKKLDILVRSKLVETSLPKEISEVKVSDGTALLRVDGEFQVLVTLGYRGHLNLWRILHMELLVGERNGAIKLEELRRFALGDDLERRMAAADEQQNPFMILYSVLHEFCVALIMDTVIRQVHALRQGRWKDAIKFELISDGSTTQGGSASATQISQDGEYETSGQRTPGVKIVYWLDLDKNSGTSDGGVCPFIKIEPGPDLQIKCIHSTFVIDPSTGKEAEFYLDQSCIDVEELLLKAIRCNRYTRLLEINKELTKNGQIFRGAGDVLLQGIMDEIGVDHKKVYENGFCSVKVPKDILIGASFLLMGFPDCGSAYFLLMQLDKDFKIVFELVETQPEQPGKSNNLVVGRVKKIDVGQMQMLEDELNLSILDLSKVGAGSPNQPSNFGLVSNYSHEGLMPVTLCLPPSSFSSIVDEIFELEKGTSAPHSVPNVSSSISTPAASHLGSVPLNLPSSRVGIGSSTQEENAQMSQINPVIKFSPHCTGSLYSAANVKGLSQSTSVSSLPFAQQRNRATQKLSVSKSEQDLASLRSPQSVEVSSFRSMEEDHLRSVNGKSQDVISSRSLRISSLQSAGARASASDANGIALKLWAATPVYAGCRTASEHDKDSRKRKVSDMLNLLPSLRGLVDGVSKRRKLLNDQHSVNSDIPSNTICNPEGYTYGDLLAEANKGNAPSGVYVSALLHVVRHCSLCIKHAMLTSQMEALDIPYVEEIGLRNATMNIWFKLPSARGGSWPHICLRLGKPGSLCWDVKINDQHFRDLWELQKGSSNTPWGSGVRIANTSDVDSHIRYDSEGVVLIYHSVEVDSIKKLVADVHRLSNARMFALGMRKLLGVKTEEKLEEGVNSDCKSVVGAKGSIDGVDKFSEQMRRAFRIEAVGLLSLWFSFGSGVLARFVVEWESGREGCTMHVSPDQLWPHTKFLEDFINGGEVASLLDCIRLTAGPLHALAAATRPARAGQAAIIQGVGSTVSASSRLGTYASALGAPPSSLSPSVGGQGIAGSAGNSVASAAAAAVALGNHAGVMLAAAGRGGSGIVPSSLLPIDVSVVLRGPYWIRIIYRKHFAVDMRCFAGDQVWLQPATPPKGGPSVGGSLPCPQFRPFIMEHVAQELNGLEPNFVGGQQTVGLSNSSNLTSGLSPPLTSVNGSRVNPPSTSGLSRPGNQVSAMNRAGNSLTAPSNMPAAGPGFSLRRYPVSGGAAHVRGELNTAIIGLGDDGGYGGGWVPLVALKKVLRGILKYLGVLWLFAQLPDLLKEILGSILKENEGALLNLDQEQPALRFFVGGYVFAVSVHRVQLLLQVLSVKRFSHQQQQQQNSASAQEELTQSEISEICDYFSRRVASEPYDASRVASFITLLTLPISVLREFLKLITWKKVMSQSQGGDVAPAQKPRIELCLENHAGLNMDGISGNLSATKSNIHYDRPNNSVDFALTVVLDPAHIPHINAAGGAAWLPYCVSVRLRYSFGDNTAVSFLGMEGSHGGRACWLRVDEWEKCKQRVARAIEVPGSSPADIAQGRLRLVADNVQRALHLCLQGLRDSGAGVPGTSGAS
uniref:Mediator of RNA polymerase II transcription subunit 14 n=1 Tax=Chenopodium quinoa TaxID=63459 RepID=A0A803KPQ0_CHEQI